MGCRRCMNRITRVKAEENSGYCEECIAKLGKQLIRDNIEYATVLDEQWRAEALTTLTNILDVLRDAGMPDPWYGLGWRAQELASKLGIKQDNYLTKGHDLRQNRDWRREQPEQERINRVEAEMIL